MSQPGKAVGVYDLTAGRGDRRGTARLEITVDIRHRTVGRSPQHEAIQGDITSVYGLGVGRGSRDGAVQLEVALGIHRGTPDWRLQLRAIQSDIRGGSDQPGVVQLEVTTAV
ncbi:hypothetical protein ACWDG9_08100 [Streptomyces sp. NPDC001073]